MLSVQRLIATHGRDAAHWTGRCFDRLPVVVENWMRLVLLIFPHYDTADSSTFTSGVTAKPIASIRAFSGR